MTNFTLDQKEEALRTETLTFRIEHDIANDLRQESKHKTEDLDVLINRILRFYVN